MANMNEFYILNDETVEKQTCEKNIGYYKPTIKGIDGAIVEGINFEGQLSEELVKEIRDKKNRIKSEEEEKDLITRSQAGDERARQVLFYKVCGYLASCCAYVRRYFGSSVEAKDLFGAAEIAFAVALNKFEANKGARFMSFCRFYLNDEFQRLKREYKWICRSLDEYRDREPRDAEDNYFNTSFNEYSSLSEVLSGEDKMNLEELQVLYEALTDKEEEVIKRIYLLGERAIDIAKEWKCSSANVSDIKMRALHKLRMEMKDFDWCA